MTVLRIAICVFFAVVSAFGQGDRGTITGTVSDPANAVVPAAKVTVRNMDTGAVSETVTTDTGNFTVAGLPIGNYEVSVEASGFKRTSQPGVRVQVAQTLRLDLKLEVGSTTESITITAESPLLRTENAEQSVNVSGERINALPLNFGGGGGSTGNIRNWLSFMTLSPGVNGSESNPAGATVNGMPSGMFKILVEGMDVTSSNDTRWTSTVAASSVEVIGEFSLQTSNFQAQYSGGLGAMFNFTTKSGTNQVHGSLYDYFTNETLFDAHMHFLANRRDRSRKQDGGGTVGGPVYIPKIYDGRDKTFFFFNLEMFRNKSVAYGRSSTVPTDAFRRGDFSAALTGRQLRLDQRGVAVLENTIYDKGTERTIDGRIYRDPYANNTIPQSAMDQVALKIQDMLPKPTNSELINNWVYDLENPRVQNLPSLKIDHNIGYTKKLSFYWSYQSTRDIPGNDPLPYPITAKRDKTAKGHTYRLNYDQSITPTFLLHLGAGYLRFNNPDSSKREVLDFDAVGKLGLRGATTSPAGFPRVTGFSSGNFGGMSNSLGPTNANDYYNDKPTAMADATYIRGNHTYKAGANFSMEVWTDRNTRGAQGIYNFGNSQTGQPGIQGLTLPSGTSVGHGYASFLLGMTSSAQVNAVQDPQWRKKSWGLYVQDNWKITRKLTLDYGVRWDLNGVGHEIHYRNSMFGPTVPNPNAGGLPGGIVYEGYGPGRCNCEFTDTYPYAISPRLGLAYQLGEKTVVRAGWALSYGPGPNWWYLTNRTLYGVGFDVYSLPVPAYAQPASYLKDGLTYDRAKLYTPTLDPGLGIQPGQVVSNVGGFYSRSGGRPQRINQWNIAVQREVVRNLTLEAAYVGNRGVWLEANNLAQMNVSSVDRLKSFGLDVRNPADRDILIRNLSEAPVIARGFKVPYTGYPTNRTLAQSLRPFPQFTSGYAPTWAPLGNSWYDSLQMKLTKRYSHGLDLSAAFTWSKELGRGNGGSNGAALGGGINNQFNLLNQKSLAGSYRPLILTTAFSYQTPRPTANKWLRAAAGDWVFGGIIRYRSGSMLGVPSSATSNIDDYTFMSATRRNRVPGQNLFVKDPGCHCIDPNKDTALLNGATWQEIPEGEWGVSAPYYSDLRWVRDADEQMSLGRTFFISEDRRMRLTVRVEFFNVFNRVTLPSPSSGNPDQTPTFDSQGRQTGGYGFINTVNGISGARNGQGVLRFEF